jgi:hypothetical protein
MKIEIKNYQLVQPDVLNELSMFAERNFRIATTIKIKKIVDELQPIIQDIDKYRLEVYKKYSVLDDKGNFVHPTGEDGNPDYNRTMLKEGSEEDFSSEMNELMNIDHHLSADKIKISELGNIEMSLRTLSLLEFMLEDDLSETPTNSETEVVEA